MRSRSVEFPLGAHIGLFSLKFCRQLSRCWQCGHILRLYITILVFATSITMFAAHVVFGPNNHFYI